MAASRFPNSQHTSEQLVKSAGAIVFRLSTQEVCLVHLLPSDEHVLAKGRRNVGESRAEAALREVREKTGYHCRLLPVTFNSRAPPVIETEPFGDFLRTHSNITVPFSLQIRHLDSKCDIKLIWWFIAAVNDEKAPNQDRSREETYNPVLWLRGGYPEADIPTRSRYVTTGDNYCQNNLSVILGVVLLNEESVSAQDRPSIFLAALDCSRDRNGSPSTSTLLLLNPNWKYDFLDRAGVIAMLSRSSSADH